MKTRLVTIEYFQGDQVVSMEVPPAELPEIAGCTTFWLPQVLEADEMERRGKKLKARIAKVMPPAPECPQCGGGHPVGCCAQDGHGG